MKVLSLFDGISCGMIALERAGLPVEKYDAYEIDESAIKISEANYPQIEHKGDVFKAEYTEGEYDLLIGGSPCTYWSIATAGNGTRETISSGLGWDLFSQYVRALHEVKPRYFLYENNASMSDEIKHEITKALGVEPILIDSADFSAQRRLRYYWTNIDFCKTWEKSPVLFEDIEDKTGDKMERSLAKYSNTYRWSKNGSVLSWDTSGKGYYSQVNRARKTNQKWPTVMANRAESKGDVYVGGDIVRHMTVLEMERLQTLPDNYTAILKNKEARGHAIGNGWTVDVIAHIMRGIKAPAEKKNNVIDENGYEQFCFDFEANA